MFDRGYLSYCHPSFAHRTLKQCTLPVMSHHGTCCIVSAGARCKSVTHAQVAHQIRTIFLSFCWALERQVTGYRQMSRVFPIIFILSILSPIIHIPSLHTGKSSQTTWESRTVHGASVSPTETIPHLPAVVLHDKDGLPLWDCVG